MWVRQGIAIVPHSKIFDLNLALSGRHASDGTATSPFTHPLYLHRCTNGRSALCDLQRRTPALLDPTLMLGNMQVSTTRRATNLRWHWTFRDVSCRVTLHGPTKMWADFVSASGTAGAQTVCHQLGHASVACMGALAAGKLGHERIPTELPSASKCLKFPTQSST
jgi:hypothetical protein